jgi:uncharacterized protein (DUF58 family)
MRGVRILPLLPDEAWAGRPAVVGARVVNTKRWLRSYSLTVELSGPSASPRRLYVPRLEPGGEHLLYWEETPPRRGRHGLGALRLTTRFPFGLFVKSGRPIHPEPVVVYPALHPLTRAQQREMDAVGQATARRRGRGAEVHNLRGYRAGDDPRLIHWRSTAKTGALTVRQLLADASEDVRLVLVDEGSGEADRLEAGLSEAASLAAHLLQRGSGVELAGPGVGVALARGRAQRARVLTALALHDPRATGVPGAADARPAGRTAGSRLGELRVRIG